MINMISHSFLLELFLGKVLKIAIYVLNWVPCKKVLKTPHGLQTENKSSNRHLYVWDCPPAARSYSLNKRKLDSIIENCYLLE